MNDALSRLARSGAHIRDSLWRSHDAIEHAHRPRHPLNDPLCAPEPRGSASAHGYTTKTVERRAKCPADTDTYHCPHITFKYQVIDRALKPEAAAAINQAITDFLLTSMGEPRKYKSIDAVMTEFMQGYQEYKQLPGTSTAYWEERTVTVRYQSDRIVSMNFEVSFFYGGLHPQYASVNKSFNAATGAKIRLADVFVPGYGPASRGSPRTS